MRDNLLRNGLVDQIVKARAADRLQHLGDLGVAGTHVAIHELRVTDPPHPNIEHRGERAGAGKAGNNRQ